MGGGQGPGLGLGGCSQAHKIFGLQRNGGIKDSP